MTVCMQEKGVRGVKTLKKPSKASVFGCFLKTQYFHTREEG